MIPCASRHLTLFDMGGGGGMMVPQNIFDHCAQTEKEAEIV